jgi:hypothetical protein
MNTYIKSTFKKEKIKDSTCCFSLGGLFNKGNFIEEIEDILERKDSKDIFLLIDILKPISKPLHK